MGRLYAVDGKQLQQQYKDHLSGFHSWDQKEHAEDWMLFEDNRPSLSIDETALSNGELYTIITNKEAKGGKKAIVAMLKGAQADQIIAVLERIPVRQRNKVKEVTMDMAANMIKAIRRCFTNAVRVIDRFHVQKLACDAVQEARIKYRWEALDAESKAIEEVRKSKQVYQPEVLSNGDTLKQLLARSRYLLFKHQSKWTVSQKQRAELLFPRYPELFSAYTLAIRQLVVLGRYSVVVSMLLGLVLCGFIGNALMSEGKQGVQYIPGVYRIFIAGYIRDVHPGLLLEKSHFKCGVVCDDQRLCILNLLQIPAKLCQPAVYGALRFL